MKIHIDIRDDIPGTIALECVRHVIAHGRVSNGEHGKKYYSWATSFDTSAGEMWVSTRQYRKSDCFVVHRNQTKQNADNKTINN